MGVPNNRCRTSTPPRPLPDVYLDSSFHAHSDVDEDRFRFDRPERSRQGNSAPTCRCGLSLPDHGAEALPRQTCDECVRRRKKCVGAEQGGACEVLGACSRGANRRGPPRGRRGRREAAGLGTQRAGAPQAGRAPGARVVPLLRTFRAPRPSLSRACRRGGCRPSHRHRPGRPWTRPTVLLSPRLPSRRSRPRCSGPFWPLSDSTSSPRSRCSTRPGHLHPRRLRAAAAAAAVCHAVLRCRRVTGLPPEGVPSARLARLPVGTAGCGPDRGARQAAGRLLFDDAYHAGSLSGVLRQPHVGYILVGRALGRVGGTSCGRDRAPRSGHPADCLGRGRAVRLLGVLPGLLRCRQLVDSEDGSALGRRGRPLGGRDRASRAGRGADHHDRHRTAVVHRLRGAGGCAGRGRLGGVDGSRPRGAHGVGPPAVPGPGRVDGLQPPTRACAASSVVSRARPCFRTPGARRAALLRRLCRARLERRRPRAHILAADASGLPLRARVQHPVPCGGPPRPRSRAPLWRRGRRARRTAPPRRLLPSTQPPSLHAAHASRRCPPPCPDLALSRAARRRRRPRALRPRPPSVPRLAVPRPPRARPVAARPRAGLPRRPRLPRGRRRPGRPPRARAARGPHRRVRGPRGVRPRGRARVRQQGAEAARGRQPREGHPIEGLAARRGGGGVGVEERGVPVAGDRVGRGGRRGGGRDEEAPDVVEREVDTIYGGSASFSLRYL